MSVITVHVPRLRGHPQSHTPALGKRSQGRCAAQVTMCLGLGSALGMQGRDTHMTGRPRDSPPTPPEGATGSERSLPQSPPRERRQTPPSTGTRPLGDDVPGEAVPSLGPVVSVPTAPPLPPALAAGQTTPQGCTVRSGAAGRRGTGVEHGV